MKKWYGLLGLAVTGLMALPVGHAGAAFDAEVELTASDAGIGHQFGWSVAVSGDTAVIGSPWSDGAGIGSGSVHVFVRSGGGWSEVAKLVASDGATDDKFGYSVAVSGDAAVIGAAGDDLDAGSAYVFRRAGGTWEEEAKLAAPEPAARDDFGFSVAISGDTVMVGARQDDHGGGNSGAAYVFSRSGGAWSEGTLLDPPGSGYFGVSVTLSGDTAVIGAPETDVAGVRRAGAAYVFTRSGGVWSEEAKLTVSHPVEHGVLGSEVAFFGDTAVIGAVGYGDSDASGAAYVFIRTGGVWTEEAKLTASDGAAFDKFGSAVAVMGETALIGAHGVADHHGAGNQGGAYVFKRTGGVWSEEAKVTASDAAPGDIFGWSVALSDSAAVMGTPWSDGDGRGSGSVYVRESGPLLCVGLVPTIVGTDADETLRGTSEADVIHGLGGNDVIKGRGGNDVICGGAGIDRIYGGHGRDILVGDGGDDELRGGGGADLVTGGPGSDLLVGGSGRDELRGGGDGDTLVGNDGPDTLVGGSGDDSLNGGRGIDDLDGGADTDTCRSGETTIRCER